MVFVRRRNAFLHLIDFLTQPLGALDLALFGMRRLVSHIALLRGAGHKVGQVPLR